MLRIWPSLGRKMQVPAQLLSELARAFVLEIWPSLGRKMHLPAQLFGELALALVLGITLTLTWSDGAPSAEPFNAFVPRVPDLAAVQVSMDDLYMGKHYLLPKPPPAPPPQEPIPTAPPVQLLIPAMNVHREVEALGVDRSGVMALPANAWNAGWYKGGPVPGAPGDAVIEGHAGYPGQPMIFGRLGGLHSGDQIVVVLSDGSRRLFLVVSMAIVPVGSAPPGLAEPYGPPRLTLITCTGHFDDKSYSYSDRLVVEASYAGLA